MGRGRERARDREKVYGFLWKRDIKYNKTKIGEGIEDGHLSKMR